MAAPAMLGAGVDGASVERVGIVGRIAGIARAVDGAGVGVGEKRNGVEGGDEGQEEVGGVHAGRRRWVGEGSGRVRWSFCEMGFGSMSWRRLG